MKIAMMVRGYLPVPTPADMIYAPIDLAVAIAEGLTKNGHTVDFYAPLGSKLKKANIESRGLRPLVDNEHDFNELITNIDKMVHYFPAMWEGVMVKQMFEWARAGKYDALHFHHPESAMMLGSLYPDVPVLYTLHDPIHDWSREIFELHGSPNQHFVSISNNQRRDGTDLPYVGTVYNGVDVKDYPFSDKPEDFLLYAGRVAPEKGVKEAIQVAKETNHRLLIIGPIYFLTQGYFEQYIKPHLNDQILYLGFMEKTQMAAYYQKAKALLTPVQWEEPFGLTTIEAMASGTPVISFRRGAASELIVNGKTGFVVDTTAEMIDAVHKIKRIKRQDCRDHVKKNFSTTKMVNGYEAVFEQIIKENRRLTARSIRIKLRQVPKAIREASQKNTLRKAVRSSKRSKQIAKTSK